MMRIYFILLVISALAWNCGTREQTTSDPERFQIFESYHQIHVLVDGQHFTSYLYDTTILKPILYPVYSPSGIRMQRQYPLKTVESESHDHPHHEGVFFTYGTAGEVNGNNFWANQQGQSKIRHAEVTKMETQADKAILGIQADWIGQDGGVVLSEERTMVFTSDTEKYAIDFIIKLNALDQDAIFLDTKEGMFAIRVADWLTEENGKGKYLNSLGDTTEANIWGKRAPWVRLESIYNGKKAGIVIMNHRASVNFPTFWHARGYGLFSANPLGQSVFQEGRGEDNPSPLNFSISAGNHALFRFKMIIYEGDYTVDQIEADFEYYSQQ